MRRYAPFYNSNTNTWSVIYNDQDERPWYVEVPNIGSEDNACVMADALMRISELR